MARPVLWDARWVGHHGIARFSREVFARLAPMFDELGQDGRPAPLGLADPLWLSYRLRRGGYSLFVSPGFNAAVPGPYRQLITVHDLIHLRVPEESSAAKRLYMSSVVRPAVRACGRVMTVSEVAKREIVDWSGLDEVNVAVVGNGCSMVPATMRELGDYESRRTDLLLVTNGKPHKNAVLAFRAVARLPHDYRLVTVGLSASEADDLASLANLPNSRYTVTRGVDDATLRHLYLSSACVLMPSILEGFGLPAAEGLALGTPTAYVCEAVGEVTGDLGVESRSASDPDAYAGAIVAAADLGRRRRGELVARSARFSWDDVAVRVRDEVVRASDE